METKNIRIVGVGGQGSLLASKLLGRLLLSRGYDIKVSEVHGMSQRGGSVVTYVRYGDKVYSPVIDKGQADYIVSFELLEAARWTEYLKPGGKIIVNTQQINPMPVIISRRPCALLKYVKHKAPLVVEQDKCVGCKACMKIGCPAVSIIGGKAKVDTTQCVGCGVCQQLCKFDALKEV